MTITPATEIAPVDDVAFRELQDDAVLLNLATGRYYGMNRVATRAWTLLAGGSNFGQTIAQLATEFDVEQAVLERDLTAWLQLLLDKGLVRQR
jgi:hypothetical protein